MTRDQSAARLLATFIGELEEQVRVMNADLLALETEPTDAERLKSLFRVAHTLKGAARAAGVPPIEQTCHTLEALLAQARDGKQRLTVDDFALLFLAADALGDAGQRLRAGRDLEGSSLAALRARLKRREEKAPSRTAARPELVTRPSAASPPPQQERAEGQVRVEPEKLDALLAASGQLTVAGGSVTGRRAALEAWHQFADRCATDWTRTDHRIRLALERSGAPPALLQAVSGMRENLRRLAHDAGGLAAEAASDARALSQATDEVAARVRQLRMRPFAEAYEALPRVVRDVATSAGKEVDLEMLDGAVEVDRVVLDGLRETLTQLVRNAVDHGIESPDQRERSGKPRRGKLSLSAALRGDRVSVTLSDDGAGLDLAAIRAQLQRRGLPIPPDERELVRALFEGGFSTRAEATTISGRGVGLDIARAAVERIRGTVEVTSEPGRGTSFTIECPPTLATIRALLVRVGPQVIAIPTTSVERLIRVRPEQIKHAEGRDVVVTEEAPVPLVPLGRLLPPLVERPPAGPLSVILLSAGGRRLAVAVDELVAEQQVVLRPLKTGRRPLPYVSGAAIIGMGRVALVLNPTSVITAGLAPGTTLGSAVAPATPAREARRRILVVDDSITTRALEQSILESAGYDVVTAVDGADGWKVLQENGCDLVVSDIEMPRMDGFALCLAIRASKRFKEVPVVLVTALETPEHRARGLDVGADAYIGKSSFDQKNLLDTIRQLVGQEGQ